MPDRDPAAPVTWPTDFPGTWLGCPREPLLQVLGRGIDRFGQEPVLLFDDGAAFTGQQLREQAERFAGYLAPMLSAGDRVALALGNRAEYVIAFLAVLANRGVVVSLSPDIGPHDARYAVENAGCVLAITDPGSDAVMGELVGTAPSLRKTIKVGEPEPFGFAHLLEGVAPLRLEDVEASLDDMVDIGYTSGTTGLPKALGGRHTETLRYMDVHLRRRSARSEPVRMLMPLQLHYGDPLTYLFGAMCSGDSLVLMRKFSASRFWDVARSSGATDILTIGSVPTMLLARPEGPADRDHSIRHATALAIPRDSHAELERRFGFPWNETYGSSESGPALSMPPHAAAEFVGTGAIGIPLPDVEARLVDPDGRVLEGPGSGELELSGEIVFGGYLDNPKATAEVLHDGWLRTGDLMRRDARGVFYFEGRRKELIRRSGINVSPAEVEAVLRRHPAVLDAAVVPVEDPVMGEEVKAYVELVPGAPFDPAGLIEFCAQQLTRQKVPRYVEHRVEPFPRTPTQRIPKKELMVGGAHTTDAAWDRLEHRPEGG
ncbi:class I adenylate-forming enzyme family protein [Kitasatospora cineracea]|uniref:Crotonobetaine/carnitine-CoA ligase n=1 Tax=Kitasatospora cineracea TaxID=88074 RepID=A0A8G1UM81_9ACTN|nr:AMP-binding protein [Kitasatospora cineracea]ROR46531.1 crotonobetaine/carnitine-CoA ligase [Kitasatospora cineracea]